MNSKLVASTFHKVWGQSAVCCRPGTQHKLSVFCWGSFPLGLLVTLLFTTLLTSATQGQCVLTCDDQKNISLGTEGYAVLFPELILNGNFDCASPLTVDVLDPNGFSLGDTVRCEEVGQTLTVKVKGVNGENCWSKIVVEDKLATAILCEDIFIPCTSSVLPEDIGYPTLRDNCGSSSQSDLNYFDLFTELPCNTLQEGRAVNARITRSWTILDQHGNLGYCTQNIYLLKGYLDQIVFPGNCDGIEKDVLNCSTNPDDLSFTGAPTIGGMPVENADLCKFYVSYQDQTSPICPPASYRILRRWEVIDLCTKEIKVHIQDIISADNTAPDLICPDSFSVSANSINCTASIILPRATAFDSCSNVVVQPTWAFGAGYGPFTDIPGGTHTITYTATDECGNTSVCTTQLTVLDNTGPTAVCKELVHVSLTNEGTAVVDASIFDGGSKDNCGITKIEAKKDTLYQEQVTLNCADIGINVPILLRVYDAGGLFNECRSRVVLDDEILPTLVCPTTRTVNCQKDYEDTTLTGIASAMDVCGIDSIYYIDGLDFNACGTAGTILRNWFATDFAGNIGTCTQQIIVIDDTPLEITFPEEYTTYECNSDLSPDVTGRPIITGDDCEDLLVSHEDEIFTLGDATCTQIIRTWKVVDWCTFTGTNGNSEGYITHAQIINILDWTAPEITSCPQDVTVSINTFDCETTVTLPIVEATDCNVTLTYRNDSPYATNNQENASGLYPLGTTLVNYTVSDGCGNESTCSVNISVIDEQAPTPVCKHSISIALRADGTVEVPHNAINSGSYDNCGSSGTLSYEISPNFFTCTDIGQQTINLIVTDAFGNADFCTTDIFIQDNHANCDPTGFSAIGGRITTENGTAMKEVAVEISGGMSQMNFTNDAGEYIFQNLSKLASYTVRPMTGTNIKDGVSTFDIVLIQKHILNIETLDSPYKLIAADVNNSKTITAFDVVLLRQVILGIKEAFPNNQSWRYVASDFEFSTAENPLVHSFPEFLNYNQLLASELQKDFIAIKIGDVNNSANPRNKATGRSTKTPISFEVNDINLKAGEEYHIPFRAADISQLLGYQMTIQFDTDRLAFIEAIPGEPTTMGADNFGLAHLDKGFLTTSWGTVVEENLSSDAILFTLVFEAKNNEKLSKILGINSNITRAEAYNKIEETRDIQLHFLPQNVREELILYQNKPNPFSQQTSIGFELPQATTATISIYTITGQLLKEHSGNFKKGYNEIAFNSSDLSIANGVLYYHLETPTAKRVSKKMIIIR